MGQRAAPLTEKALEIFEGLAGAYDRTLDLATVFQDRRWKRWLLERSGVRRGSRVLDVGCGTCVLEESLEPLGCEVVGVDLTEEMVRIGRSKGLGSSGSLVVGDAQRLPFSGSSFDSVLSCYVPKYCAMELLVPELSRVTRAGGRLVMYDFAKPVGRLAGIVSAYEELALPVAGAGMRAVHSPVATTFEELPGIIKASDWDRRAKALLERSGMVVTDVARMTAGTVAGFAAVKPGPLRGATDKGRRVG
jgi:demethylmenaquinone methyltransferase / 2-methoxy-6-polyprenyl-1,4-benzoquinol methylase